FGVSIFCIAAVLGLAAYFISYACWLLHEHYSLPDFYRDLQVGVGVGFAMMAIMLAGSLFRIIQLRSGGAPAVARMVGARMIRMDTPLASERVFLNVVEEMAIA